VIDRDEDWIGNILRRLLGKGRFQRGRSDCPDEESLASYLAGRLSNETKESLEAHLAGCSFCVDEIVATRKAAQDTGPEIIPQRLMDRAMGLVTAKQRNEGVFDLVVRVVKDSIELVMTSGQWMNPAAAVPVGVRGRPQATRTSILQVEKEIGKFTVSVEVELIGASQCQVVVGLKDSLGNSVDNVRLTLLSEGREQASYLTRHGEAVFDHIPKGEYHLSISESGNPLGTIRLRMEEEDHE